MLHRGARHFLRSSGIACKSQAKRTTRTRSGDADNKRDFTFGSFHPLMAAAAAGASPSSSSSKAAGDKGTLAWLNERSAQSWTTRLQEDAEGAENFPNNKMRQVRSGHFVYCETTPLPDPYLVT